MSKSRTENVSWSWWDHPAAGERLYSQHTHFSASDQFAKVTPPRPDLRPPGQGSKWWITAHTVEGGHRRLGWLDLPKAPEPTGLDDLAYLDEVRY